jgi:hypothetical protein
MSRDLPHNRHTSDECGVLFVSFKGHESQLCHGAMLASLFGYIDGAYDEARMRCNVADLENVLLRQIVLRDVSIRGQPTELLRRPLAMPLSRAAGGSCVPRGRGRLAGACADRRPRGARHTHRDARNEFVGMQGPWSMLRQAWISHRTHSVRDSIAPRWSNEGDYTHRRAAMGSDVAKRTSKRWYQ